MKRNLIIASLVLYGALGVVYAAEWHDSPPPRPTVQIAILLDTSNSMDGLIGQAKTQLWNVVNEFVRARKYGRSPAIHVALIEYGKQSLPSHDGFVRLILPLTDDLDRVSEELFALRTNGGEEYCGWAIKDAVNRLDWNRSDEVYKAIFIAGNEPFSQGIVDFRQSCRAAFERGIIVNTIFCGTSSQGEQTGWKDGAVLADGRYMSIDQNVKIADIPTPNDSEIARLGVELNKTYLPYGRMGSAGLSRQSAQDANAIASSPSVLVSRSIAKGNSFYCNDAWDLVDAIKNGRCNLDEMNVEDLPADLRKLDKSARRSKIDEAARHRAAIQTRILGLNKDREQFLAVERQKGRGNEANTLDQVVVKAIRDQAARYHFTFE